MMNFITFLNVLHLKKGIGENMNKTIKFVQKHSAVQRFILIVCSYHVKNA